MKALIITSSLVLIIILITGIYTMTKAKTETQKYEVLYTKEKFEIRFYPEAILATVEMNGTYDNSRNSGFQVLAGYIFGGNEENSQIAMTSPVRMSGNEKLNSMSFVLPSEMEFDKLPEPKDKRILLHKSKPMYTASVQFGGYANEAEIAKHREKLAEILNQLRIKHSIQFEFLGYNSPFQPLNRRNEVQFELVDFNPNEFIDKMR
ncbi:MAG TPA: SOUL heme-binding protein [Prolixibacteraceae bacterium]|nr:SOUL heme-binding protein [Prolixibacteraceae bacterium]